MGAAEAAATFTFTASFCPSAPPDPMGAFDVLAGAEAIARRWWEGIADLERRGMFAEAAEFRGMMAELGRCK